MVDVLYINLQVLTLLAYTSGMCAVVSCKSFVIVLMNRKWQRSPPIIKHASAFWMQASSLCTVKSSVALWPVQIFFYDLCNNQAPALLIDLRWQTKVNTKCSLALCRLKLHPVWDKKCHCVPSTPHWWIANNRTLSSGTSKRATWFVDVIYNDLWRALTHDSGSSFYKQRLLPHQRWSTEVPLVRACCSLAPSVSLTSCFNRNFRNQWTKPLVPWWEGLIDLFAGLTLQTVQQGDCKILWGISLISHRLIGD